MSSDYADGTSFRQALESRLKRTAQDRALPLNTLRQKVVMERFLARLFARGDAPWRLKGGYAMELRLAPRARTTRDLDLAALHKRSSSAESHDTLIESLRESALLDLGDFLEFAVQGPGAPLAAGQAGGFRFRVTVTLGGRAYAGFHVDTGLDGEPADPAESLTCEDHLGFANILPARALLVTREHQFAEKLHAYTRPWGKRTNTRTKDLIDLLLLIELGMHDHEALRKALDKTFGRRGSHSLPQELPTPPTEWADEFAALARQVALAETTLEAAFHRLSSFWRQGSSGGPPKKR